MKTIKEKEPVVVVPTKYDSDEIKTICDAININSAILLDLINRVDKLENPYVTKVKE